MGSIYRRLIRLWNLPDRLDQVEAELRSVSEELERMKTSGSVQHSESDASQKGMKVLLEFIRRRHVVDMPPVEGSIRKALLS